MADIAVIGAGSWGTTLCCLLAEKDCSTSLWVFEKDLCDEMKHTRVNSVYLGEVAVPETVLITNDLREAVSGARFLVTVVPVQYTRVVVKQFLPYVRRDSVLINASKGIERGSLLTVSSVIRELTDHTLAVLSGPSFAKEVIRKLPTAVTISCRDEKTAALLQELFTTQYFRVYTHDDVLGVELGGALKNVIAIAAGISDGLSLGNNARAALITRGLAEIKRLGTALGAREETFSGLSGLGDLILTCTAHLSRNYSVGLSLGKGLSLNDILSGTKSVAEGVTTAESAFGLSRKYEVAMPIVAQVYAALYEDKGPAQAVRELMNRSLKHEFHE